MADALRWWNGYNADFGEGFGLKSVVPALVSELRYDDLPIADGATATLELERLLFNGDALLPDGRERLRDELLRYCHQDTWGLIKLSRAAQADGEPALLEPAPGGALTLGACIEIKWWIGVARQRWDVAKMRELCPDPSVRKLMLLAWGLPGDSTASADWVQPGAREIGLVLRPSWRDSFQAAVNIGARGFSQEGRLWLALMEIVAA